jgi:uridine phosphorylase
VVSVLKNEFPILEFDDDRNAFILPEKLIEPIAGISEKAVLCFFTDAIEKIISEYPAKIITHIRSESTYLPVHEIEYHGEKIVLVQALVGAPMAAAHIEELTALGCKKYVVCGGCGVLQDEIAVGHLIIPASAVRDEGTSYHYAPPSREISMSERAIQVIESVLNAKNAPYIKAKTWTTDAFYRETPAKIRRRKEEGCVTVEMEASAFFAVAKYLDVELGQILYAGDSLAGETWDGREWANRTDIREAVLKLSLDSACEL